MAHLKKGGYSVEYAKSGRSSCANCGRTIADKSMRIGVSTPSSFHDGFDIKWNHMKCVGLGGKKLSDIKGWEMLRWDDQIAIRKATGEPTPSDAAAKEAEKRNKALWDMKDQISGIPNKVLSLMLEANGINVNKMQADRLIHKAADGLLWGKISPCPECKGHTIVNVGYEYECHGWISEFTRCEWREKEILRYKWSLPEDVKEKHKLLKTWKYPAEHPKAPLKDKGKEADEDEADEAKEKEEEEAEENMEEEDPKVPEDEVPMGQELYGMNIVFAGTKKELGKSLDELMTYVREHGGEVYDSIGEEVHFMISSEAEVGKKRKTNKVKEAIAGVPIFTIDYLTNLAERKEEGIALRDPAKAKKYLIAPSFLEDGYKLCKKYLASTANKAAEKEKARLEKEAEKARKHAEAESSRKRRREPKKGSEVLRVDPNGPPGGEILVTQDEKYGYTPYNVMLNITDIQTGANKYYRMQIVKKETPRKGTLYQFFVKWGRMGTDVGDDRTYEYYSESKAINHFAEKFEERTSNKWAERDRFQKKPGQYFMAQLDDGGDDDEDLLDESAGEAAKLLLSKRRKLEESSSISGTSKPKSTLDPRVQDLIKLIFDPEMMKNALKAMEIDIKKMPLGKIKRQQLMDGYLALSRIQEALNDKGISKTRITDLSNRFYNLIPHDFGTSQPPLINDTEAVKKKMAMLETLLNLEIASNLLKESEAGEDDPVEANYKNLKTQIKPVDRNSELYSKLVRYVKQSHDTNYFTNFGIKVVDIYEIEREGENDRFQPWKDNSNRQLLWHGSRLTNWVGILSQGLRIAPPEAPTTGYRFGKGVYFADVVSKSASYCFTTKQAPQAVMLLSEVALGKMNELKRDQYMEKPPAGTDSTKALGMTIPNPAQDEIIDPNVKVPLGTLMKTGDQTSCSHNEYIVYNVNQIHSRFLLRVEIEHKR